MFKPCFHALTTTSAWLGALQILPDEIGLIASEGKIVVDGSGKPLRLNRQAKCEFGGRLRRGDSTRVDQTFEVMVRDPPPISGPHQSIIVNRPQDEQRVRVTCKFVSGLHIAAHVRSVAIEFDLLVGDLMVRSAKIIQSFADPRHVIVETLNRAAAESTNLDVVGETRGIPVEVALVDRRGITDHHLTNVVTVL